ncbi:hypothetical protein [Longispora urticae]
MRWWVAPVVVLIAVTTVVIVVLGENAASLVGALGFAIAALGLVVALLEHLNRRDPDTEGPPLRFWLVCAAGALGVIVLVAGVWWGYNRWADVDVDLGGPFLVSATSTRTLVARIDEERWRGDLEFGVLMTSDNKTGDCVQPAMLRITASADARWLVDHERTVRTGGRVSIPIPEGTRVVKVFVEYLDPANQGCEVTATLTDGTLSR